ncbi:MAG: hypothetical protein KTR22_07980 [Flavobacteriaceae bacterium]|nr:hypothetical protein [Flavobacteriaceae bacterium]
MFEQFSYKKKFYAVLILSVLLGITAYKRSFSGALQSIKYYKESKKNISANQNSDQELIILQGEVALLDNVIGKKVEDPNRVQHEILDFISQQETDIGIARIAELHISQDEFFTIYSNQITLKGSFENLQKMIYAFEKQFDYARIANSRFYTVRDPRTRKKELFNDIIFQNYEKK